MTRIYLGASVVAVLALLGGLWFMMFQGRSDDPFASCRSTQIAGGAGAIGGPFELVDHTGATVTEADVFTRPSLVYFGYTYCPDVCPLDTARNVQAIDLVRARGLDAQPVFITVDPRRDTVETMAEYVSWMHPDMIGLTGSGEQVRAAAQAYRVFYSVPESEDEFYLVDHTTFSYLMMPGHGFVEVFRRDIGPEQLADQLACFIAAS